MPNRLPEVSGDQHLSSGLQVRRPEPLTGCRHLGDFLRHRDTAALGLHLEGANRRGTAKDPYPVSAVSGVLFPTTV